VSQRRPPGRPFAARSRLLLVTAGVLVVAGMARLPVPSLPWHEEAARAPLSGESRTWARLRRLEPGNGPEPAAAVEAKPAATPAVAPAVPPEPASQDPLTVTVLQELADELGRHQAALAEREHRLALRESVMASVETRIGEQLARLEALKAELERLTGEAAAADQARIAQMVKVYEAMKAKNAAAIFEPMALDLLLPIVRGMRETKVAAIVAEMDPAKARALTAELVRTGATPPRPSPAP
jgi:flagellar motility protein MotE (MotC chaperone)